MATPPDEERHREGDEQEQEQEQEQDRAEPKDPPEAELQDEGDEQSRRQSIDSDEAGLVEEAFKPLSTSTCVFVQDAVEWAEKQASEHAGEDENFKLRGKSRKERNRVSAKKWRLRKKYFEEALTEKVEMLEQEALKLRSLDRRLTDQVPRAEFFEPNKLPGQPLKRRRNSGASLEGARSGASSSNYSSFSRPVAQARVKEEDTQREGTLPPRHQNITQQQQQQQRQTQIQGFDVRHSVMPYAQGTGAGHLIPPNTNVRDTGFVNPQFYQHSQHIPYPYFGSIGAQGAATSASNVTSQHYFHQQQQQQQFMQQHEYMQRLLEQQQQQQQQQHQQQRQNEDQTDKKPHQDQGRS